MHLARLVLDDQPIRAERFNSVRGCHHSQCGNGHVAQHNVFSQLILKGELVKSTLES